MAVTQLMMMPSDHHDGSHLSNNGLFLADSAAGTKYSLSTLSPDDSASPDSPTLRRAIDSSTKKSKLVGAPRDLADSEKSSLVTDMDLNIEPGERSSGVARHISDKRAHQGASELKVTNPEPLSMPLALRESLQTTTTPVQLDAGFSSQELDSIDPPVQPVSVITPAPESSTESVKPIETPLLAADSERPATNTERPAKRPKVNDTSAQGHSSHSDSHAERRHSTKPKHHKTSTHRHHNHNHHSSTLPAKRESATTGNGESSPTKERKERKALERRVLDTDAPSSWACHACAAELSPRARCHTGTLNTLKSTTCRWCGHSKCDECGACFANRRVAVPVNYG